jgi:hypothetical protein
MILEVAAMSESAGVHYAQTAIAAKLVVCE